LFAVHGSTELLLDTSSLDEDELSVSTLDELDDLTELQLATTLDELNVSEEELLGCGSTDELNS